MLTDKKTLFINRTSEVLGVNLELVENLFSTYHLSSLRINTLKASDSKNVLSNLSEFSQLEPISWCSGAYLIKTNKENITGSTYFREGLISVQNASSLLPPLVLNPSFGTEVLDMCSSPGIKASHLAAILNNTGFFAVNEPERSRTKKLEENLKLLGVKFNLLNIPAQFLNRRVSQKFDYILVDAPCSGEGMIDLKSKDPFKFWNLKKVHALSKLQKRIMNSAVDLLKKGGTLVYSTCTLSPDENEEVIDYVIKKFPEMHVMDIDIQVQNRVTPLSRWQDKVFSPEVAKAIRIKPSVEMEAFFVCKLKKD
jgi:16S rRNA (cytosine1407-C5)-methyltransferase